MPTHAFDRRREEFPTLESVIYLLSHSLGPLPRAARDQMSTYVDRWEDAATTDPWGAQWWALASEVGDRIARVLGGAAGSVQVQPSATAALSSALSCFDWAGNARRKIVTSALDFPSTTYLVHEQRRVGARVEVVPTNDGISIPTGRLLNAIDEDTALVAISHTSYRSSARMEVEPLIERAHRVGAMVLLDVYQSAGVVEIDATGWGVDFLVGGSIKWLCGGPACGYLYVRPELIERLQPRETGWIGHEDPFEFAAGPVRYAPSIRRFAQGTFSVPGLYSCIAGLDLILDVGIDRIASESRRRTSRMIDFAREHGWRVNSPLDPELRGGTVMIGVERPAEMASQLAERGVLVDWRPGAGLRISPHFFNTDKEIEEALAILFELMRA